MFKPNLPSSDDLNNLLKIDYDAQQKLFDDFLEENEAEKLKQQTEARKQRIVDHIVGMICGIIATVVGGYIVYCLTK